MELKQKYPKAFESVMSGTLRFAWDSFSHSIQEQTLKDITKNMEYTNGNNR